MHGQPLLAPKDKPICPYCGGVSHLATGDVIYPHRPDLAAKLFYRCTPCDAFVGCHPGTITPLGILANAELRKAKQAAHSAFDPMWKAGELSRKQAYKWLAHRLGIDRNDCHIGMMSLAMCRQVVDICNEPR